MLIGNYELVFQELQRGVGILVLNRIGRNSTFIDDLASNNKTRSVARSINEASLRLIRYGSSWALTTCHLKRLKDPKHSIAIYELRISGSVHRVMAYIHDDPNQTPVLLFHFEGHKGLSRGGIKQATLDKGRELASIAQSLMRKEFDNDSQRK